MSVDIRIPVSDPTYPDLRAADIGGKMISNFAAARVHLDRACHYLQGDDAISLNARQGLDILLEAVIMAEHLKPKAQVIHFPDSKQRFRNHK
jgi:hypothetical protein